MEFIKPKLYEFTIYSKSGCPNCRRVKSLLTEMNQRFTIIDCDDYLLESKEEFLQFIHTISQQNVNVFPIVFDNNNYIGGFLETQKYLGSILDFDSNF